MNTALNLPSMRPFSPKDDLKVVVACEGPRNAYRAGAMLERVARNSEAEGRLICSWWHFEVLATASLRKLAADEAMKAGMIVIAADDGPALPEEVIDWIGLWVSTGEYHPRALVALLDPDTTKKRAARNIVSQLKKVAEL